MSPEEVVHRSVHKLSTGCFDNLWITRGDRTFGRREVPLESTRISAVTWGNAASEDSVHILWITRGEGLFPFGQSGRSTPGHRGLQAQFRLVPTAVSGPVAGGAVSALRAVFTQLWELLVELFVHPMHIIA